MGGTMSRRTLARETRLHSHPRHIPLLTELHSTFNLCSRPIPALPPAPLATRPSPRRERGAARTLAGGAGSAAAARDVKRKCLTPRPVAAGCRSRCYPLKVLPPQVAERLRNGGVRSATQQVCTCAPRSAAAVAPRLAAGCLGVWGPPHKDPSRPTSGTGPQPRAPWKSLIQGELRTLLEDQPFSPSRMT